MNEVATEALSPLKRALVEIRELKARLAAADGRRSDPIAIVGTGLRLPGGVHDRTSYWELLRDGIDAISEVPASRWLVDDLYDPDPDTPGRMATRWGGWLDRVDEFDAPFFGISRREAENLDPQQRVLLEVAWEALEDANIAPDSLFESEAGMFLGIANSDYMRLLTDDPTAIDPYTVTGNALSTAAGRVSYVLGAQGPALSIDTACSSSLVAVHLAVRSLRDRECDLALAGGVNLILAPEPTIGMSRARTMASDGRCKTFDASADGFVRSEGCALIALKRLDDAVADGDRVLSVIRGSAVNQDGRSGGLTAPNGPSQEQVIRAALDDAGVEPTTVGYVEAHGTGTSLGDPIEIGAIGNVLCAGRSPEDPLIVGSVKTNIGHTEAVAGVAGLIKTVLMLEHAKVPPHLHLDEVNPHIASRALPIAFPRQGTGWQSDRERIAGVSSFGISGTNAHVVLAEAPPSSLDDVAAPPQRDIVTLSARHPAALAELARRTADRLRGHGDVALADLARSTNLGRAHLDHRLAVVADDVASVADALDRYAADPGQPGDDVVVTDPGAGVPSPAGVVFLFTGHGAQYRRMGAELAAAEPVFAAAFDRCDAHVGPTLGRSLRDVVFGGDDDLTDPVVAQPALFALQFALTELLASWGVHPTVVAGHSAGEYVAAVVAGVMSLEDGLDIICARGRLMASLQPGEMVALFAGEDVVAPAVARHSAGVSIASVNGPGSTVISGTSEAVAAVIAELGLDDDEIRRLPIDAAAHSPLLDPVLDEFTEVVAAVQLTAPALGLVSSMTGTIVGHEVTDPTYWRRHLRETVRFADVFETLRSNGSNVFVEIGPDATLLNLGRRNWPDATGTWVPSMQPEGDEATNALAALASLHVARVDVDWKAFATSRSERQGRAVTLEPYPWQRESYWSPAIGASRGAATAPMWPAMVDSAARQAGQGPLDLDVEAYPRRWELLDGLALAFIARTFTELGLFTSAGETVGPEELVGPGRFAEAYERLAVRWLGHLVAAGHLVRDGDRYVARSPLPSEIDPELLAAAVDAFAGIDEILRYVQRCGEQLTAVVNGTESGLSTLFPDGSYETVDFMYHHWAVSRYFNGIVRAAVDAASSSRRGQRFRVLEVGAGTGGTTAAVLPVLAGTNFDYTLTDVSDFFLTRAAGRFAEHPEITYSLLDIEGSPEEQGYPTNGFDVVIAANVLHATRDLDATLAHVRSLLAPGGALVAFESIHHPPWFDVTTGLIEGWNRFEDSWRTDVPLIDTESWRGALDAAGFQHIEALPGADAPASVLLQQVILARAPGDEVSTVHAGGSGGMGTVDADRVAGVPSGQASAPIAIDDGLRDRLEAAVADERDALIVDAVRLAIGHVLRIAAPGSLPQDQPLLDLGFDSLMAVELRDVLRQSFALEKKLPATLAFDHPTIGAIAGYLDRLITPETDIDVPAPADGGTSARPETGLDEADVAELSEAEAEARLLAKLEEIES